MTTPNLLLLLLLLKYLSIQIRNLDVDLSINRAVENTTEQMMMLLTDSVFLPDLLLHHHAQNVRSVLTSVMMLQIS